MKTTDSFRQGCVNRTVEEDLPREIDYLQKQDTAKHRIMNAIDMPDRTASDFILFVLQNDGTLPKRRRKNEFKALSDQEIEDLQSIVTDTFDHFN